jgi:hypothetical protein
MNEVMSSTNFLGSKTKSDGVVLVIKNVVVGLALT